MELESCDSAHKREREDVKSGAKFHTKRKLEDIDASNANEMFPGPFCFTPIVVFEETPTKPIKNKKKYMCTFQGCSKEFAYPHTRDRHQQTHNGEQLYKCSVEGCSSAFSRSDELTRHECTHTGEKNHKCSFDGCNKAFTQASHRDEHERIHRGERPYKCSFPPCGKEFTDSSGRVKHERIHRGERPYKCSFESCGKTFTFSNGLVDHVKHRHWDRESPEYKEWNDKCKAAWKLKYHSDPEFRAAHLCRNRLRMMLKSQGGKKQARTNELVGCTWAQLVVHLNDNIFGYKVGDKGLHIDHIRPCASFQLADNPISQRACMNFNNLQLMPAEENIRKSDFYDPEAYAEMPSGKAIAVLSVDWEKQFPTGVENDVDFDSDSEWEEDFEEDVEYEYEIEMEF
jgi:hypothetical protein